MIDDHTRLATGLDDMRRLDEVRRQISLGDQMRRLDEAQRYIALGNEMRRFDEIHKQIALVDKMRLSIDQLSPLNNSGSAIDRFSINERMRLALDQVAALDRMKPAIDQISVFDKAMSSIDQRLWNNESVRRSLEASAVLSDANNRLHEQYEAWDRIGRSLDTYEDLQAKPEPIQIPAITRDFEHAREVRAKRDRKLQNRQSGLLASIVEAGKKQNEITRDIARLQETLVTESLENSRLQRVVLYFTALSAVLALISLFK
ncbi:MAG: hypothetical protein ACRECO_15090 [Xanthobacteraceae bacterium]